MTLGRKGDKSTQRGMGRCESEETTREELEPILTLSLTTLTGTGWGSWQLMCWAWNMWCTW